MNKLTWQEFEKIMQDASKEGKQITGVIVFKPESFDKEYSEQSRSYEVSSGDKYWNPEMIGSSLYGFCLDGTDQGARLDWYMKAVPKDNLGKRWLVDYCYLKDDNIKKAEELVKVLRNPENPDERVEINKLPNGKYQTLYYSDEKSFSGAQSQFDSLDSAISQAQKLRPTYKVEEAKNESIEEDVTPVVVEFWETEEDRDIGEGSIYSYYKDTPESIREAIKDAKHVMHLMDYASIEVHDTEKEKTYFWTDGVTEDFPDKIEESLVTEDKDDNPVEIKFWRTTQDRELGLSGVYKSYPFSYEAVQDAISEAKKLRDTKRYASVEVFNKSTGNSYYWGDRKKEDYPLMGKKELDTLLNGEEEKKTVTESTDKFYDYVKALLDDGAIDDPEYYNTLSDEEKDDLIRNTWMKDDEIIADYKALNESQVRDAADSINQDDRYSGQQTATMTGMLADRIADIAEELGDDYSEWLDKDTVREMADEIVTSDMWTDFNNELDSLIREMVEDKVDYIRKDEPASRYYEPEGEELTESKEESDKDSKKKRVAYNIEWDVDDEEDLNDLPKEVEIPDDLDDEDEISDYLSDLTGFCHNGFELTESKSLGDLEEVKKLEEASIGEYLGYTFIPVGNIKSTVNVYDVIESDPELDRLFNDESGYKYGDFYKALPEYDIFEIKELDYKRVVPIARGLFKFTGDRKTYNTISEIKSDEELSQIDNLGFIGDSDDKEIVSDLQNEDLSYSKISVKYGFAFNKYQLYNIATVYETADDDMKEKIEELLTDINYHSECAEIQEDTKKFKENLFKEEKIEEDYTQASNAGAIKIDILGQPSKKRSKKDKEDPVIKSLPAQQVLIEDKCIQRTLVKIYPDVGNSEEIYIDVPDTEDRDEYIEKWLNDNRENWNEYRILTESADDKFKQLELAMAKEVNHWLITRYDIDLTDNYATGPDDFVKREDFEDYVYKLLGDFSSALFLDYEDKNNLELMWDCEIDPNSPYGIKVDVWEA